jgi:hypothetical protein
VSARSHSWSTDRRRWVKNDSSDNGLAMSDYTDELRQRTVWCACSAALAVRLAGWRSWRVGVRARDGPRHGRRACRSGWLCARRVVGLTVMVAGLSKRVALEGPQPPQLVRALGLVRFRVVGLTGDRVVFGGGLSAVGVRALETAQPPRLVAAGGVGFGCGDRI